MRASVPDSERFAPCAVYAPYGAKRWKVLDRKTGRYVPTDPKQFIARGSAALAAENLNKSKGERY